MTVDAVGDPWTSDDIAGWAAPPLAGGWLGARGRPPPLALPGAGRRCARTTADGGSCSTRRASSASRRVGPLVRDADIDRAVLAHLAVLKLNEDEARILAGALDAASLLALGVPEVVLTLGSEGARVVDGDAGLDAAIPPHPVARHESHRCRATRSRWSTWTGALVAWSPSRPPSGRRAKSPRCSADA